MNSRSTATWTRSSGSPLRTVGQKEKSPCPRNYRAYRAPFSHFARNAALRHRELRGKQKNPPTRGLSTLTRTFLTISREPRPLERPQQHQEPSGTLKNPPARGTYYVSTYLLAISRKPGLGGGAIFDRYIRKFQPELTPLALKAQTTDGVATQACGALRTQERRLPAYATKPQSELLQDHSNSETLLAWTHVVNRAVRRQKNPDDTAPQATDHRADSRR